ncbi:MAG TPA: EamA family transporter, partial [Streptomyces sp.]|nr:EamA family transporter [Streptomyces sp.]
AVALWLRPPTVGALLCALAAGVLSSAVPFLADLLALRRVPARSFGIFMSVNPVCAALVGLLVLGQHLAPASWLAITVIVTADVVAVGAAAHRSRSVET